MNIYSRDWDALIVLDGCRVDALKEVASEYDFIRDIDIIWSVGSASHEWTVKTFTKEYEDEIRETAMIMANAFADRVFEQRIMPPYEYTIPVDLSSWNVVGPNDFYYTEWTKNHRDPYSESRGFPELASAEYPTERAILAGREQDCDRLIVQYYQPHRPFLAEAMETEELTEEMYYPFESHKEDRITFDELWRSYIDNLRYGLDNVELLLKNLDADKVVITADHGELMGELGLYGHKEGLPHPALKKVPWVETTATDQRTVEPNPELKYKEKHV
ncbi:hypothetical protein K0C01_02640 [Salinarchaeum sp. IM2453]|uniref:hypothetical protein n=1 Tax=Salinarchaeum sp. IM2453 TaxID=2862870 RepID=UPI001C82E3B1|nr:hypothetical protein [Salinarchaeum sp. IM2453]QZA89075.1 hypothetical protein K0C01_02640 [Salinarchaeum sp. IM2453]